MGPVQLEIVTAIHYLIEEGTMYHRNRLGSTRQRAGVIVLLALVGMSPMAASAEEEKGNMVFSEGSGPD